MSPGSEFSFLPLSEEEESIYSYFEASRVANIFSSAVPGMGGSLVPMSHLITKKHSDVLINKNMKC